MAAEKDSAAVVPEDGLSSSIAAKPAVSEEIPLPHHIMGRTVGNPAADIIGEVKAYQKPRLGVRVPYLNLTSQIVSQDEIAAELLERAQKKHPSMIESSKMGDMFFTMKMTHRLVKSIKPVFPEKSQQPLSSQQYAGPEPVPPAAPAQETTSGNSDPKNDLQTELMEFLRNENPVDETVIEETLSKPKKQGLTRKSKVHVKLDRELEKKLALQQLQEFTLQKQLKKEMKMKMKTESKEKEKDPKPKKRGKRLKKLKNIVINRRLDETEAPILPYKSLQRKFRVSTLEAQPLNGAEVPKVTASVNEVTEAPPVPDIKVEKNNRYMKKYSNKRFYRSNEGSSGEVINGANEIIDEIASEILDSAPKKKMKRVKGTNNNELVSVDGKQVKVIKRKSRRKQIESTQKQEEQEGPKEPAIVENGSEIPSQEDDEGVEESVETLPAAPEEESVEAGKRNSRMMREIDRLLMDEGAINMLYSIEEKRSPKNSGKTKANLLPSTRRKKKDLLLKTKLVKSAVLKLSGNSKRVPNRVQRQSNAKVEESNTESATSVPINSQDSIPTSPKASSVSLPAEASRIIRRHSSSSSFSSTAGSPRRVSIDFEQPLPNLMPGDDENVSVRKKVSSVDQPSTSKHKKKEGTDKPKKSQSPKKDINPVTTEIVQNAKSSNDTPSSEGLGKLSSPVKNDVKAEMSKTFNKKASSPSNVIRKTLYMEEKNTLNSCLAETAKSFTAMPPPQEQNQPAATSTPVSRPVLQQDTSSVLYKDTSALDRVAHKEFLEKLERLEKQQTRLPPSIPIPKVDCYREINIKKIDNLLHITLTPTSTKVKNSLNIKTLRELISALHQAASDKTCRVVLISSLGATFCQGLDFENLIEDDAEKRKTVVVEHAMAVRDFILGISSFNKLLVAGVHGAAVGLGVTMLAYFDMVFASDKATFYTPYTKLGQVPEGAPALTMMNLLSNAATSELIYGCRQLTASEALRCGLVTRILWPDRFQEELLPIVAEISTHSAQAMEATKTLMRREMRAQLNLALAAECHLLVKNWNTPECQKNFRKFLEDESFWQISK